MSFLQTYLFFVLFFRVKYNNTLLHYFVDKSMLMCSVDGFILGNSTFRLKIEFHFKARHFRDNI